MKDQTRCERRDNGIYYYRRRVPKDLRQHYPPSKKEIIFSLRTSDRREAFRLARLEDVKHDQHFQELRAGVAPRNVASLAPDEIERLALIYKAEILAADEFARDESALGGPLAWMYDGMDPGPVTDELEALAVALSHPSSLLLNTRAEDRFLAAHNVQASRDTPAYVRLIEALKEARMEALRGMLARFNGQRVQTPIIPAAQPTTPRMSLDDVVTYWKGQASSARPARTVGEVESIFRDLQAQAPGKSAAEITKTDVIAYKDTALAGGKSAATVKKKLGLMKAVFSVSVANEKLAANPAASVKAPAQKGGKKSRVPYDKEDLRKIFASPVYAAGIRPRGGKGEAAFWMPLIGAFTGARQAEIGQLQTADIVEREPGLYCFHFTDESAPDQRLKNAGSRRWVPIHVELIECGLLDYWRDRKAGGEGPLFPLLTRSSKGDIAASWSQWWGRYSRKEAGIVDKRKVFHSFRHGFKDALRECGVEKAVNDALTGHASADVGDGYGGESYPLKPLREAIAALRYTGLDLSRLYRK